MVIVIVTANGGGFFSIFNGAISKILNDYKNNLYEIKAFKIRIPSNHFIKDKECFDKLFNYDNNNLDSTTEIQTSASREIIFIKANKTPYYEDLRYILFKNTLNKDIITNVEMYKSKFKIDKNTLAVHIRLTDMNVCHASDYGCCSFVDYCNRIDNLISSNTNITSIFICSDNDESINKIITKYGNKFNINFITDAYRVPTEVYDNYKHTLENFNNQIDIEIKLLTEVLVASSCSYLIHRVSDFANFIILYSNTLKEIECLN